MIKMLNNIIFASTLLIAIICAIPRQSDAEEQVIADTIPVMPKVTVTGSYTNTLTTTETIDQELIEKLPSSNGNITELLKTVPGVQLPEGANSSRTGGEIKPPEISISGGRVYESKFILDGIGINNTIDPGSTIDSTNDIPAHSHEFFIPEHLIKDVTVYRSNIPARYGGFTGGLIIANTKDPETEFSGEIEYKTTHSEWGQFYIDSDDEADFNNSTDSSNQPDFLKHNSTALVNIPVSDSSSALLSYSRLESSIPLILINKKKVEYRRNENIFAKYLIEPNSSTRFTFSSSYTPYQSDNYLKNTLNSDYSLKSGGLILKSKFNKATDLIIFDIDFGWAQSENSRRAPQNWKNWQNSPSKNWGSLIAKNNSPEGGYGDIEKKQKSLYGKLNLDSKELSTGIITHKLNTGIEVERTQANYDRLETTTKFSGSKLDSSVSCAGENIDCIDGEQFFYFKNIYPKDTARAEITNYNIYLDDSISIYRLSLRPGLRVSYNDYQKNTDYAPRFAVGYDLFGDKKTILTSGFNRYYGTELLAHKLAEQKAPYQVWRRSTTLIGSIPQDWYPVTRSIINAQRISDLKTPYSNEFTIGLQQELLGGTLELVYIDRDYKNQLMTESLDKDANDYKYQEFRNTGRRYHEEFSISWERSWQKQYFMININWQDTKSNSLNYSDIFDPDLDEILVWYKGKPIYRDKLITSDFNRPYTANFVYSIELLNHFYFTNETRYTSRYRSVERTGNTYNYDGTEIDIYEDTSNPSAIIFDWKLLWQSPEWHGSKLEFFVDILNVFNRRVTIGNDSDQYKLGRQYWAGLTYKF